MSAPTIKPLLYVIAVLALAVLLLGNRSCVQSANARTDAAKLDGAEELVARVRTERDAWKRQAEANADNANTCAASLKLMTSEYQRQQRAHATLDAQREAAIIAAERAAADSDRALQRFTAQFQAESRTTTCGAALAALNTACPALKEY